MSELSKLQKEINSLKESLSAIETKVNNITDSESSEIKFLYNQIVAASEKLKNNLLIDIKKRILKLDAIDSLTGTPRFGPNTKLKVLELLSNAESVYQNSQLLIETTIFKVNEYENYLKKRSENDNSFAKVEIVQDIPVISYDEEDIQRREMERKIHNDAKLVRVYKRKRAENKSKVRIKILNINYE